MLKKCCLAGLVFMTILTTLLLWNEYYLVNNSRRGARRKGRGRKAKIGKVGKIPIIPGKPLASKKEYDQVKSFVLFIGYPRSGHTLVSTLIEAHPNAIIANEFDLIGKWQNWKPQNQNKYFLFDQFHKNSHMEAQRGYRTKSGNALFSFYVSGQFQGKVQGKLKIIGAKKGGRTTKLMTKKKRMKTIETIMATVNVPFKFLHVVRNPYDNIATMLLRTKKMRLNMKPDFKLNDSETLDSEILKYFNLASRNQYLAKKYAKSLLEIQNTDLIRRPKEMLKKMCKFLGLTCSQKYLDDCVKIIFKKPSHTRNNVVWTVEQKRRIKQAMKRYSFLKRFSFDSD
ncbi:uncharacterized protein LOC110239285 [Exaiptasia diaphana]|uniref:Protein-tyrosine sulfotransferase n=1 Tax=Exaiptasia diaphana TaxID=2652724 RepID=A0A913X8P4_EXADI|nr:uncharacterized protein LOC110239285 [Exaiptasia diaphana]KXJ14126.1 hypothetical protein AC249_AIPGENE7465 [Exaiptasia diaphana]